MIQTVKQGAGVVTFTDRARFGVTPGKEYKVIEIKTGERKPYERLPEVVGFYITNDYDEKCYISVDPHGNPYSEKWELTNKTKNLILIEGPQRCGKTTLANAFVNPKIYDEEFDPNPAQFDEWPPFNNIVFITQTTDHKILIASLTNIAKRLGLNFTHIILPSCR